MRYYKIQEGSPQEGVIDKYNSYKSSMRFLKVSLVNIEVKTRFINIPF